MFLAFKNLHPSEFIYIMLFDYNLFKNERNLSLRHTKTLIIGFIITKSIEKHPKNDEEEKKGERGDWFSVFIIGSWLNHVHLVQ